MVCLEGRKRWTEATRRRRRNKIVIAAADMSGTFQQSGTENGGSLGEIFAEQLIVVSHVYAINKWFLPPFLRAMSGDHRCPRVIDWSLSASGLITLIFL